MKKTWKSIGAIAVSVPMIAFAACGLKKSEDPAATFATFTEKFTTAAAGFTEGKLFLDYYQSATLSAEGVNGEIKLTSVSDSAFDFENGVLVKCSAKANMETQATIGGVAEKSEFDYSYYLTDGFSYTYMSAISNNEEQETKMKAPAAEEELSIAIEALFGLPTDSFENAFAGMENVVIESDKNNTVMKITADVDSALFAEYLYETDDILGDYNYDVDATIELTVRFDNAGNLLYVETLMECSLTVAENANEGVEPTEEEIGGEESPEESPEEEPATPTDSATIRIYQKASVKTGSVVKLPSADVLATYKTQEELNGEE